ncbi:MAG: putative colanic acid biosynthesis UDP-glucose lipid carrier transferase [Candidatus Azotimanducaceae bacterium]
MPRLRAPKHTMITDDSRQLVRDSRSVKTWVQMILDQVVVQGLLLLHTYWRAGELDDDYRVLAIIVFLLMQVVYHLMKVYQHESSRTDYISALMQAWGTLIVLLGLFGFVTKTSEDFSRLILVTWAVTGFFGQLVVFFVTSKLLGHTAATKVPTIVVGSGELAKHIARSINENDWVPDHVIGYVSDSEQDNQEWNEIPCLGDLDRLEEIVTEHGGKKIYIALPMDKAHLVKPVASIMVERSIDVLWAPDIFGVSLVNHSVKEMAGVPLISLSETPLNGGAALAKDLMDKMLAVIALILAAPIMIFTAIVIKLTSPGPILFKQPRHGWDGRVLEIYKFRSMKVHEEEAGQVTQARKNDDRITTVGRFIRRTSIDELPQLFNILGGSMSLVGPRPHAIAHNNFYKDQIKSYMLRHRIKPGLTGLAQVNGYRGETDTLDKMEARVKYDLAYINNWSIWLDVEILFRTIFVLLGKNAY